MKLLNFLFLGIITASGALVLEMSLTLANFQPPDSALTFSFLFFAIPLIEEILKLAVLGKSLLAEKTFENIIKKSLLFGAGFFLVELALNLSKNSDTSSILPLFGVLLIHLFTSCVIGYTLSRRTDPSYFVFLGLILLNTIIHFSYNSAVLYYF